jgi:hypothetical protein
MATTEIVWCRGASVIAGFGRGGSARKAESLGGNKTCCLACKPLETAQQYSITE